MSANYYAYEVFGEGVTRLVRIVPEGTINKDIISGWVECLSIASWLISNLQYILMSNWWWKSDSETIRLDSQIYTRLASSYLLAPRLSQNNISYARHEVNWLMWTSLENIILEIWSLGLRSHRLTRWLYTLTYLRRCTRLCGSFWVQMGYYYA